MDHPVLMFHVRWMHVCFLPSSPILHRFVVKAPVQWPVDLDVFNVVAKERAIGDYTTRGQARQDDGSQVLLNDGPV